MRAAAAAAPWCNSSWPALGARRQFGGAAGRRARGRQSGGGARSQHQAPRPPPPAFAAAPGSRETLPSTSSSSPAAAHGQSHARARGPDRAGSQERASAHKPREAPPGSTFETSGGAQRARVAADRRRAAPRRLARPPSAAARAVPARGAMGRHGGDRKRPRCGCARDADWACRSPRPAARRCDRRRRLGPVRPRLPAGRRSPAPRPPPRPRPRAPPKTTRLRPLLPRPRTRRRPAPAAAPPPPAGPQLNPQPSPTSPAPRSCWRAWRRPWSPAASAAPAWWRATWPARRWCGRPPWAGRRARRPAGLLLQSAPGTCPPLRPHHARVCRRKGARRPRGGPGGGAPAPRPACAHLGALPAPLPLRPPHTPKAHPGTHSLRSPFDLTRAPARSCTGLARVARRGTPGICRPGTPRGRVPRPALAAARGRARRGAAPARVPRAAGAPRLGLLGRRAERAAGLRRAGPVARGARPWDQGAWGRLGLEG
jgi:hypothetical protein